jgi:ubiquinone/menaquinone biosynthesis C-methylase UbiE
VGEYRYKKRHFNEPSFMFRLEDAIKNLAGGRFFYGSYIKSFSLRGDERILDFGCGGGAASRCVARLLSDKGFLTCLDTSEYWAKKARHRLIDYRNVEVVVGDIRSLDLPDRSYDVIYTIHVIHDIEPELRGVITEALLRKLKYGGAFHIKEPIKKSHGMPLEEIRTLLSNTGLEEIYSKTDNSEYYGMFKMVARSDN